MLQNEVVRKHLDFSEPIALYQCGTIHHYSGAFRTLAQIESMMPGLALIEPGIVKCAEWWPDGPRVKPLPPVSHCIVGVVGRKP